MTETQQAAAVIAAELLSRVCRLDSLEAASRLSGPARDSLHAIFILASGSTPPEPQPTLAASSPAALAEAERALADLLVILPAPLIHDALHDAHTCLAVGADDPRLAAAADAVLAKTDELSH